MKKLTSLILPLILAGTISCSRDNSPNSSSTSERNMTLEERVEKEKPQGKYKKMKNYFARQKKYEVDIGRGEKLTFIEITSEPTTLIETKNRGYASREEQAQEEQFNKVTPFAIMETELTWQQFKIFLDETAYDKTPKLRSTYAEDFQKHGMNPKMPITGISSFNAKDFCEWLQDKVNTQYPKEILKVNLPTPAQFMYALAEKKPLQDFMQREITSKQANIVTEKNPNTKMKPIKSYSPNSLGLYDMIGNAEEYVLCTKHADAMAMGWSYSDNLDKNKEDRIYRRLHSEIIRSTIDSAYPWSEVGFRPVLNIN